MSRLSADLRTAADEIWDAKHRHPFLRGIGDGPLNPERFLLWIRQAHLKIPLSYYFNRSPRPVLLILPRLR